MTPKRLLLDVLAASPGHRLSVSALIAVAELFGISENHLRVTVARMRESGLLRSGGRGIYKLGPAALTLADAQGKWRFVLDSLVRWNGEWVAVHAAALPRTDRTAYRQNDRALGLCGFAPLRPGLWVRPNNLRGDVDGLRLRLSRLGLDSDALVFGMHGLGAHEPPPHKLWDTTALDASYVELTAALRTSVRRLPKLSFEDAAREAFTLGGQAIHAILFDPLLPAPMVNETARRLLVNAMSEYDGAGHRIWKRFFALGDGRRGNGIEERVA